MTHVRAATLISAPIDVVFDHARDLVQREECELIGLRAQYRRGGRHWALRAPVVDVQPPRRIVQLYERGSRQWVRQTHSLVPTGAGTLLTIELRWALPRRRLDRLVAAVLRRRVLRVAVERSVQLRVAAEQAALGTPAEPTKSTVESPQPGDAAGLVVVGAALLADGRVLAAQRSGPAPLAGRWEFPGGKVEPGESETEALVRECWEELGVEVELADRLGDDLPVQGGSGVLRIWTGRVVSGEPAPYEHAALRWLPVEELDEVDWLPADRPLLGALKLRLATPPVG